MGRSKKRKNRQSGTRESSGFASPRLRSSPMTLLIDDRRSFDFAPATRPARLFTGSIASVTATLPKKTAARAAAKVPYQIAFSAPRATLVCVRRQTRKEILHALGKTGRGGQRKPRRNKWSDVKC